MRCQFLVDIHARRAVASGAEKKEFAEAIAVATFVVASLFYFPEG
ncbi:MAG: carboxymuconolactone decarboxylase family protein [Methanosarcina mazei]|jgi:AhpD family alkylhydroperoxidase|nr:carboxymuconolactone decarboxylase family protein [Methanosarcina soligelidi]